MPETEAEKYDAQHGKYKDAVDAMPLEGERLPTNAIPKAPDRIPFKVEPAGGASIK
jgi:hypothetical protein